jgi:hypothetical protein
MHRTELFDSAEDFYRGGVTSPAMVSDEEDLLQALSAKFQELQARNAVFECLASHTPSVFSRIF